MLPDSRNPARKRLLFDAGVGEEAPPYGAEYMSKKGALEGKSEGKTRGFRYELDAGLTERM
jgi:hypothetical protein